uniref:Uncharacterized protein n=1 Tax=viral metagenome TaxID=1070528 RepID=A0A6M3IPD7_9ZZZZ
MNQLLKIYAVHKDGTIFESDVCVVANAQQAHEITHINEEILSTMRSPDDCTFIYHTIGEVPG